MIFQLQCCSTLQYWSLHKLQYVFSNWSRVNYFANALAYQTWPHKPSRMFQSVPTYTAPVMGPINQMLMSLLSDGLIHVNQIMRIKRNREPRHGVAEREGERQKRTWCIPSHCLLKSAQKPASSTMARPKSSSLDLDGCSRLQMARWVLLCVLSVNTVDH